MTEQSLQATLIDTAPERVERLPVQVIGTTRGINLFPEGYGDFGTADGHGSPVFVELHNGQLRLIVWADINNEEPTHIINLDGAKENRRT